MPKRKTRTRKRQAQNKRRKGLMAVILPWAKRFGVVAACVTGILWLVAWFVLSDANDKAYHWIDNKMLQASADLGFSVQDVFVEGRHYTDAAILKAIINIEKDDPIFAFDPDQAKAHIRKIAWVEDVHIERRLPDTLYIDIQERRPIALWQAGGSVKLIDDKGAVIPTDDLSVFKDLMTVIGQDAPQDTARLVRVLAAQPDIENWVSAAGRIAGRRWDLVLDNGVRVKLPESDEGQALQRLAEAQDESDILNKNLKAIDLRDPSRIIIRTHPGAVQDYTKANY